MVKQNRWGAIIATCLGVGLAGCSSSVKKVVVPVVVEPEKPRIADACLKTIPALSRVPMPSYERSVINKYPTMTEKQKARLISQQKKRILQLLDVIIQDRTQRAIDVANAKACRKHVKRRAGK